MLILNFEIEAELKDNVFDIKDQFRSAIKKNNEVMPLTRPASENG